MLLARLKALGRDVQEPSTVDFDTLLQLLNGVMTKKIDAASIVLTRSAVTRLVRVPTCLGCGQVFKSRALLRKHLRHRTEHLVNLKKIKQAMNLARQASQAPDATVETRDATRTQLLGALVMAACLIHVFQPKAPRVCALELESGVHGLF